MIGMVGFGEAAQAFVQGWGLDNGTVIAYDIKLASPPERAAMEQACHGQGVIPVMASHLSQADIVFCLVTADQATAAAECVSVALQPGTLWLDGNSCSPGAKRRAATLIEKAGGRYVDLAIMAPVHPKLHRTPVLVSGQHSDAAVEALERLGMLATIAGGQVGDASSIKMMRSIIVKGIEALTAEAFIAARKAGVEKEVLESLQASDPGVNWSARGAYNLERMLVHGARRAAEMQEVALTLRELGLPDRMAAASMEWQAQLAELDLDPGLDELTDRADRILARLT